MPSMGVELSLVDCALGHWPGLWFRYWPDGVEHAAGAHQEMSVEWWRESKPLEEHDEVHTLRTLIQAQQTRIKFLESELDFANGRITTCPHCKRTGVFP